MFVVCFYFSFTVIDWTLKVCLLLAWKFHLLECKSFSLERLVNIVTVVVVNIVIIVIIVNIATIVSCQSMQI